jgi:hypothetical protein
MAGGGGSGVGVGDGGDGGVGGTVDGGVGSGVGGGNGNDLPLFGSRDAAFSRLSVATPSSMDRLLSGFSAALLERRQANHHTRHVLFSSLENSA